MPQTSVGTKDKIINLLERRKARLANEPRAEVPDNGDSLPDVIRPPDIMTMSDDQLDTLLNVMRLRRLTSTMLYEQTQEEKQELRESRAKEQLDAKCDQVFKELERTIKNLEKLELKINEMRALRIQAGLEW